MKRALNAIHCRAARDAGAEGCVPKIEVWLSARFLHAVAARVWVGGVISR